MYYWEEFAKQETNPNLIKKWENHIDVDAELNKPIYTFCEKELCVYFDMDGVLANWNKFAIADTVYAPNYFKNLDPVEGATNLINMLINKYINVGIITKANISAKQNAVAEKLSWLKKHIPNLPLKDNIIFVPLTQNKSDFDALMTRNKIIIDDYNPNLYEMQKNFNNCICIKALNGINSQNKDFDSLYLAGNNNTTQLGQNFHTILDAIEKIEELDYEI